MKLNTLIIAVAAASIVVMVYFTTQALRNQQATDHPDPVRRETNVAQAPSPVSEGATKRRTATHRLGENAGAPPAETLPAAPPAATSSMQGPHRIRIALPKPVYQGTPKEIKNAYNLEPPRNGQPYPAIFVPIGCDKLLSLHCKVTSSDPDPIIGELSHITDGDKEHDASTYVELGPGKQWVQIDLEKECEIYAVCVWHYFAEMVQLPLRGGRVYRDVICQISNDPDFIDGVVTVFNNDHDNSSKRGVGKDKEYIETNEGRPFPVDAVKGRYVRFYSRGNTSNEMNHYIEIEIYGRDD